MTIAATPTTTPAQPQPAAVAATPDPERYVTYRSLLPWLGGTLVTLSLMGAGLTVWILGSARAEAQVPLARVNAVEQARKDDAETSRRQFQELAGQVSLLRTEIRQDGSATRGKIDDLLLLLATGKVRAAQAPKPTTATQVPTSMSEAP